MYRYEATSLPGFIQQFAVSYVGHGYFFYVTGLMDNCHNIPNGSLPVHSKQWRATVRENESP
jgi:hypothetical protein